MILCGKGVILTNRDSLINYIFEVTKSIKKNEGVALYIQENKGFENWFKVEICRILCHYAEVNTEVYDVKTKKKIDIVLNGDEWAISLKDRRRNTDDKHCFVMKDLDDLKKAPYKKKYKKSCLVFLTFSEREANTDLDKDITEEFKENKIYYKSKIFKFNDYRMFQDKKIFSLKGRIWFAMNR